MWDMTPRQIVAELDKHIIGQNDAKRAVAIALRNRWRWNKLDEEIRRDVSPKNIIMIGPTGVGKTEITRRLANLTGAPLVKVEASKYTEVGYHGRDVESMVRDLVDNAINLVRNSKRNEIAEKAEHRAEERLLDLLLPQPATTSARRSGKDKPPSGMTLQDIEKLLGGEEITVSSSKPAEDDEDEDEDDLPESEKQQDAEDHAELQRSERTREKFREMLRQGLLDERMVELSIESRNSPVQVFSNMGMEQMDFDLQNMFEKIMPRQTRSRKVKVKEARDILLEQEIDALMDKDVIHEEAIRLAERSGIIFIDEIDKVCGPEEGRGPDVSRQGVQRDLLPIVEGTTVQTRYGTIKTDFILFIAAGAFHRSKPSDLMPELQGRFPIRVELKALTETDFVRILTEPTNSLTQQYASLLATDGVDVQFTKDGVEEMARVAFQVNQTTQNIGARRLHTILERLLEAVSFEAPEIIDKRVEVDAGFVQQELGELVKNEDLSKFIL
ncbi:MAG: ATP-dependent protease ATPase subunit HslU [Planctomycetaceae bacterium]